MSKYGPGLILVNCHKWRSKSTQNIGTKGGNNRGVSWGDRLQLLKKIWLQLRTQLGWGGILELIGKWSLAKAMAGALESGNVEAVKWLLSMNPELFSITDYHEQNILHNGLLLAGDEDGNSVLHYAAYPLEKEETSSTLRAATKMTKDVAWFKQVEKKVPRELRTMRNKEGKTPKDIFLDKHKDLSREVKDTAKGIAESGMLVAALVATVAFAAAVTVPEPSSNLSQQTPVGGASSVPQDESRGLNEMTPEDLNSLKKQVCEYACKDKWKEAESIFNKYADIVRIPLNDNEDRALHVAVDANSITFVKGLVNLMTPQDLEIQNRREYTAFYMAAMSGNIDLVQIMIEKNQNLPLIKSTSNGMLPVHWAAIGGHHKIVQDLSSKTLLQKMDPKGIEELFGWTISSDMFDVTTKLFKEYPDILAIARCGIYGTEERTALEILLRKPSKELSTKEGNNRGASSGESLQLLQKLWLQLRTKLECYQIWELMDGRSFIALADALESGNVEAVKWLLSMNPELLFIMNHHNGQNILHYAVRQRHSSIVSYIFKKVPPNHVLHLVDDDGNNILHLAAYPLKKEENSSSLRATTKMTREVAWFKQVEKNAPPELRTKRNKEGKKPKDVFHDEHKELSKEVKDTAKGIADSGMLVAALVATVAFAAALVVPGDKTNPWFIVFILANAAALFTSSASILTFLSNFTTSRFADSEFVIALHPSLILGPMLLLISIVTMIISFAAASFLIFEHTSKWVAYVVTSMGVFPILLFLLFQFSIFDTFIWSRFYRMSYAQ